LREVDSEEVDDQSNFITEEVVGDSPEGPLKQPGESRLKPAKNQNRTPLI
jgi:hypothetical protein